MISIKSTCSWHGAVLGSEGLDPAGFKPSLHLTQ